MVAPGYISRVVTRAKAWMGVYPLNRKWQGFKNLTPASVCKVLVQRSKKAIQR
ncbi:hypothetical protein DPMN_189145 [Dreissena polymorpha]|uniref:Uncharacterized protein n=1 Tax=Dreissena polymorpha TaxID=45954 RepID=A0A9D4DTT1_DREPO|nr:hypothetical protein DPMN_189145 [Dreissena polymorpha]